MHQQISAVCLLLYLQGKVKAYSPQTGKFTVQYDDGQCEALLLERERFIWHAPRGMTAGYKPALHGLMQQLGAEGLKAPPQEGPDGKMLPLTPAPEVGAVEATALLPQRSGGPACVQHVGCRLSGRRCAAAVALLRSKGRDGALSCGVRGRGTSRMGELLLPEGRHAGKGSICAGLLCGASAA